MSETVTKLNKDEIESFKKYYNDNKDADMELMYLDSPGLFRFIKNTFHK